MQELIDWDWQATLFLNDWGNAYVDQFFLWITEKYNSLPLYILLLYVIWRHQGTRNTLIVLVCVAVMIAASDQLASLCKHGIERWRPFQDPEFGKLVSAVGKQQGRYGFYSAHASSTWALAFFLYSLFRWDRKIILLVTFLWAGIVAYSRIYLGVHYLGDVLAGILVGFLLGILFARVYAFAKARYGKSPTTSTN